MLITFKNVDSRVDQNKLKAQLFSYRGFTPSKQFESDVYQLYLKYASPQELENDIVFVITMRKMYHEIKELNFCFTQDGNNLLNLSMTL